jgi:hypothetical protein
MQYKVVVQNDRNIFADILVPVGNAAAVRNVAAQHIEPLGSVVPGMQPNPDANDAASLGDFLFRKVQQAARDASSAKCRKHIQVLDLRNLQF